MSFSKMKALTGRRSERCGNYEHNSRTCKLHVDHVRDSGNSKRSIALTNNIVFGCVVESQMFKDARSGKMGPFAYGPRWPVSAR